MNDLIIPLSKEIFIKYFTHNKNKQKVHEFEYILLLFSGTSVPLSEFSLPQAVADKIGKLVMDKFTEIIVGQASQHSRRKVLAGIVMTTDGATMDNMEVISVTTGTKCINGEHMSVNGNSLNGMNGWFTSKNCSLTKQIRQSLGCKRKHYLFVKVDIHKSHLGIHFYRTLQLFKECVYKEISSFGTIHSFFFLGKGPKLREG